MHFEINADEANFYGYYNLPPLRQKRRKIVITHRRQMILDIQSKVIEVIIGCNI